MAGVQEGGEVGCRISFSEDQEGEEGGVPDSPSSSVEVEVCGASERTGVGRKEGWQDGNHSILRSIEGISARNISRLLCQQNPGFLFSLGFLILGPV